MSTLQKIQETLQKIPNHQYITVEKIDDNDYDAYVVDLDPTNLDVVNVDEWGGGCGE